MMADGNASRKCLKVRPRVVIQERYRDKLRSRVRRVNGSGGSNDLPLRVIQGKAGQRFKEARAAE